MRLWKCNIMAVPCLIFLAGSVVAQTIKDATGLQGTVLTEDGKPVAGAYVTAVTPGGPEGPSLRKSAGLSNADGTFNVQGLPAGRTYTVCVQVPARDLLDPCRWSASAASARTEAGKNVTGLQIKLQRGATLRVRIEDPSKYLALERSIPGAHLQVGVWTTNGLFYPAQVVSKQDQGREYAIAVPVATDLKLSVYSRAFELADDKGSALASAGASVAIRASTPGESTRYVFRVRAVATK
jgi:hypothetical protein